MTDIINEPSGLINVNKPAGVTSFWVVKQAKRLLKINKVGHCGTLDPMACGVLIVVFGTATKLQSLIMNRTKIYRTRLCLGITTDTGDITGKILTQKDVGYIPIGHVQEILKMFVGEIKQIPPMYSALKHKGQRLYKLARLGISVERQARSVKIYKIELIDFKDKYLEIRVHCSGGTYIRTLGEDIGNKLGCGATLDYLCREEITPFNISSSIDGNTMNNLSGQEILDKSYQIEEIKNILL